jgi:transmembrane sensor
VNNDTKIISVLLQEGSVNLRFPNGEVTQMKPGDYFSLDESKRPVSEELVRAESLNRHIVFDNTPITQVIREIENRYNVRVEVVSSELKNKQITGILPNDNLQILLQALSVAMDCSITQEKQTIFIKSAFN